MPTLRHPETITFEDPAKYRIEVSGAISEASRSRFVGMTIEFSQADDATPRTTLSGLVRDQAELRGLLDALYGLHLSVLSVERYPNAGEHP
jgi:hypothetical protein